MTYAEALAVLDEVIESHDMEVSVSGFLYTDGDSLRSARAAFAAENARLTAEKREIAEIAFDCCQKYYDMDSVPLTVIRDALKEQAP